MSKSCRGEDIGLSLSTQKTVAKASLDYIVNYVLEYVTRKLCGSPYKGQGWQGNNLHEVKMKLRSARLSQLFVLPRSLFFLYI